MKLNYNKVKDLYLESRVGFVQPDALPLFPSLLSADSDTAWKLVINQIYSCFMYHMMSGLTGTKWY